MMKKEHISEFNLIIDTHNSFSLVSYDVSILSILEDIDHLTTGPNCTKLCLAVENTRPIN